MKFRARRSQAEVAMRAMARMPSPLSVSLNRRGWLRGRAIRVLPLVALAMAILCLASMAGAEEKAPTAEAKAATGGVSDFDRAVHLALRQSPYFTKGSLEIDIKRLDESDSRAALFPSISFRTYYYVNQPSYAGGRAYSLSFYSESYNPFAAYLNLQVRKVFTRVAILTHLKTIADGIQRLGGLYLQLEALRRSAIYQKEFIELARQNLAYAENRLKLGTGTTLEMRLAAKELENAKLEMERIDASRAKVIQNLKSFLGLKPSDEFTPDLREVHRQVVGQFDPATVTLDQVRARSYDLKIMALNKELQTHNITLAKTKLLPNLFMIVQNPDPLNSTTANGLYFAIGLDMPVWDGLMRYRNISRQRALLKQLDSDREVKDIDLTDKWIDAQQELHNVATARKMAQSDEELAELQERQSAIRYRSGGETMPTFFESRKKHLEAKKAAELKVLDYDLAMLNLRKISGDLSYTYVNESSWEK
jgi:outer membrane protein TolC